MPDGQRCEKCEYPLYIRSALLLQFNSFAYCEVCNRKLLSDYKGQLCPSKCLLTEGCTNPNCSEYYLRKRAKAGKIIPHWPLGTVEKTT